MFNVGDKVRRKKEYQDSQSWASMPARYNFPKNKIFRVVGVQEMFGIFYLRLDGLDGNNFSAEYMEKASPSLHLSHYFPKEL